MHQLVAAEDGVGRAGLDAQGAAYAPGFVDDGHCARAFETIEGIERPCRQSGDPRETLNTFSAARRTLIEGSFTGGNGLRVSSAICVTAARTLRLGQCRIDAVKKGALGG